jgi:formiminotetrahydrofolate cyclodeaminase
VAEKAHEVSQIVQSLYAISNPNMKSDLTTAQALADAAITGALANVEINVASLKDQVFAAGVRKRVESIKD